MKTRKILAFCAMALLFSLLLMLAPVNANEGKGPSGPTVAEGIDVLGKTGQSMGQFSAHGNNQTRIVTTSSGSYLGLLTGEITEPSASYFTAALIRVLPDGTCKVLKEVVTGASSTTITVMADNDENVWMYSGWDEGSGHFMTYLWCYRVETDSVDEYLYSNYISRGNGYGYSVACMDRYYNKIYAITGGGDAPNGYFAWGEFDIETGQWSRMLSKKVPCRYCYHYAYPDGNGGFFVITERDIRVYSAFTDLEGVRVSEALQTFHSRSFDANYMWDEPTLIHVPDLTKSEVVLHPIEADAFDVKNGLYPNCNNSRNDVLVIGRYVYFLLSMTDNGVPGTSYTLIVLDMDKDFEEVARTEVPRLYGPSENYSNRLFLDTAGNLYLFALRAGGAKMEIWKAEGEMRTDLKLLEEVTLEPFASQGKGFGAFIMSSSRANATPSDTATFILEGDGTCTWFAVDLSSEN